MINRFSWTSPQMNRRVIHQNYPLLLANIRVLNIVCPFGEGLFFDNFGFISETTTIEHLSLNQRLCLEHTSSTLFCTFLPIEYSQIHVSFIISIHVVARFNLKELCTTTVTSVSVSLSFCLTSTSSIYLSLLSS